MLLIKIVLGILNMGDLKKGTHATSPFYKGLSSVMGTDDSYLASQNFPKICWVNRFQTKMRESPPASLAGLTAHGNV